MRLKEVIDLAPLGIITYSLCENGVNNQFLEVKGHGLLTAHIALHHLRHVQLMRRKLESKGEGLMLK